MSDATTTTPDTGAPAGAGAPDVDPAERLTTLVQGVPGVAGMSGGTFGEVATYLPGRRVRGVRVEADVVEVHVVAEPGRLLLPLADAVRAACAEVSRGRPVNVFIDDLDTAEQQPATAGSSAAAG